MRRGLLSLLSLLLIALPLRAQTAEDAEEVYLSFRYQGGINEIVVAQLLYGDFYLPISEIFQMLGIEYKVDPGKLTVSGTYLEGGPFYKIDLQSRTGKIGNRQILIPASESMVLETDFFLHPRVYLELFQLDFNVDLSRLVLSLKTPDTMPVVVRQQRRARQRISHRESYSDTDFPLVFDRDRRTLGGFFLDYALASSVATAGQLLDVNSALGGELLQGDMEVRLRGNVSGGAADFSGSTARWRYVRPFLPWFSTFSLGAIPAPGITSPGLTGVSLSNDPIEPRYGFDEYLLEDSTDPDSEIEVYQDDRLVEVIRSDEFGFYRIRLPLNYGKSDIKLRIYSPSGRISEQERTIDIPFEFLKRGEVQVHTAFGKVQGLENLPWALQRDYGYADVNIGMTSWLTNRVSLEYQGGEFADRPLLYDRLNIRAFKSILVNLDIVPRAYYYLETRAIYPSSAGWTLGITHFPGMNLFNLLGANQLLSLSIYLPTAPGLLPLTTRFTSNAQIFDTRAEIQNNLYWESFFGHFRARLGLRDRQILGTNTGGRRQSLRTGVTYSIPRSPLTRPWLRGLFIRLDTESDPQAGKLEQVDASILKQLGRQGRIQLNVRHDPVLNASAFELTLMLDLEKVRSNTSVRSQRDQVSLSQTLRGSIALDRNLGTWIFDNRQQVSRAGISVRMFNDSNGNGHFDAGETVVPGNPVHLVQASSRQITQGGITRLTQLQPYRRYRFTVNESLIRNPALVPAYKSFAVIPDPNRFKQLDIPLVTTGIIEGRVMRIVGEDLVPVGGLRIHLQGQDGEYEQVLRTFADGSYYAMEIPPGRYEATIDESQLGFLETISNPEVLYFVVESLPEGDFKEGLDFLLE